MSTRSLIGVMHGSKCKSVYCHFDGYLNGVGAILQNHYDSPAANNLVALGDISSLGKSIGEKHPFSSQESQLSYQEHKKLYGNMTTFYGRDRGEAGCEFQVSHSFDEFLGLAEDCGAEYYYVMRDGVWYAGSLVEAKGLVEKGLVPLATVVDTVGA